ncbi:MAG: hypothetical protein ACK57O_00145, partial [Planctomyces sp.]
GLSAPHNLDATRQLCSTPVCWVSDFSEGSFRTAGRRRVCGTSGSMLRLAALERADAGGDECAVS